MKKIFALLCIIILSAVVFACGKNKTGESTISTVPPTSASESTENHSPFITTIGSEAITAPTASSATATTSPHTVVTSATSVSQNIGTSQTAITSQSSSGQTTANSGTAVTTAEPTKTETVYDKNGNVIYKKHIGANGKASKEEFFEYDSSNNLTARETVEYTYDKNERLTGVLSSDISAEGALIPNNETAYEYDEQGNLISEAYYVSGKNGCLFLFDKTEYTYTGNKLTAKKYTVYDENGKTTLEKKDFYN